jgi:hypothetical protein
MGKELVKAAILCPKLHAEFCGWELSGWKLLGAM